MVLHIALSDDHSPTLKRLTSYFRNKAGFEVCMEATNGYDLILQLQTKKKIPEVILVDINMPVIDGVAVTFYLSIHYPSIRVIALSSYDDIDTIRNVFSGGARGYLIKANIESDLETAIGIVVDGDIYVDPAIGPDQQQLRSLLMKTQEDFPKNVRAFGLTPRELTFVVLNATVLSYDQIAQIMFVEIKTIQTYFDRVSKKVNVSSRQALTIFAIQNGLAKLANFTPGKFLRSYTGR